MPAFGPIASRPIADVPLGTPIGPVPPGQISAVQGPIKLSRIEPHIAQVSPAAVRPISTDVPRAPNFTRYRDWNRSPAQLWTSPNLATIAVLAVRPVLFVVT